jgi:hypothetical protein
MGAAVRKGRGLTAGERSGLSPGLVEALDRAGAAPRLIGSAHPGARLAALWRGAVPILARGDQVHWPRLQPDVSRVGERSMAVLQHELQHVLDYASGELTVLGYLMRPRNWTYRYRLTEQSAWSEFGAEQRAQIAEHYWLLGRGRADLVEEDLQGPCAPRGLYQRVIPWA